MQGWKENKPQIAIWRHFLKMGTPHILNAESSSFYRVTWGAGKKAFQFLFVQFCAIGIYMPI